MSESIPTRLKRAAIVLADALDYSKAAESLSTTPAELRDQVAALETQLCLQIFTSKHDKAELTEDGQVLIKAFREAIALHDKNT